MYGKSVQCRVTYTIRAVPTRNASGSIVSIGFSESILKKHLNEND